MSKIKMRGEDEHVRLRVRVREICTSIHSHFQHFYLSTFVLFSFSTFLFSAFFLSILFLSAFFHPFYGSSDRSFVGAPRGRYSRLAASIFQRVPSRWYPFFTSHRLRSGKNRSNFLPLQRTVLSSDCMIFRFQKNLIDWTLSSKKLIRRERHTEIMWLAELPAPPNLIGRR
jgi:hypothetical protein